MFLLITGSTPTHSASGSSTDREKDRGSAGKKRHSPAKFRPPDQPPARKDWVPDTQQHVCMVCKRERFTMVSDVVANERELPAQVQVYYFIYSFFFVILPFPFHSPFL